MKIPELNSFQLNRTETGHAAKASFGLSQENYARTEVSKNSASFGDYLLQAFQQEGQNERRFKVFKRFFTVCLSGVFFGRKGKIFNNGSVFRKI